MSGSSSSHTTVRPRRPDESMSLLVDIASSALDPGYAEVAARREANSLTGSARAKSATLLAIGLAAAALLVVLAVVQAERTAPAAAKSRESLVAAVQRQTRALGQLELELAALRAQTSKLRDADLAGANAGSALA